LDTATAKEPIEYGRLLVRAGVKQKELSGETHGLKGRTDSNAIGKKLEERLSLVVASSRSRNSRS